MTSVVDLSAENIETYYPAIVDLLQSRRLSFPIPTRLEFIEQMVVGGASIVYNGITYDTRFAAGLLPDLFFPLHSRDDLLRKAVELIISRGLAPMPPPPLGS